MTQRLLLLLPEVRPPGDASASWWRLDEEAILEEGSGADWRQFVRPPAAGGIGLPLVALAPSAAVRLSFHEAKGETDRQRLGVARAEALAGAMADPATVHAVAGIHDDRLCVASVANGTMVEWLDWFASHGVDPDAIVPAGLLLPPTPGWTTVALGAERIVGRDTLVFADEPALREALVGEEEVATLPADALAERLRFAAASPLNLRSGRFARRRLLVLDWRRVRELAAIAATIPLLGALIALAMIIRLNQASDRLEAETVRLASAALGSQVTAAAAGSALDARISQVPGASGSPFVPLAAVYQHVQQVPGASASSLSWRPDGTLVVSLAATRVEDLNRILAALQRSGFRVTAVSRTGTTGQAVADITVRSAP